MPFANNSFTAAEPRLQHGHAIALHVLPDDQLIGGPQEQQPHHDADRRDHQRVDQPGARRHGDDVPIADGRDRDHAEVDDVDERDLAVDLVAQGVAIRPQEDKDRAKQQDQDRHADEQGAPRGLIGWQVKDLRRPSRRMSGRIGYEGARVTRERLEVKTSPRRCKRLSGAAVSSVLRAADV
ncbi:MAG TPA: hypothetical protein VLA99_06805 [Nitrospiraceae bacterium]|nr:hypothetical protein [Nitrospiraceae bacterium]